MPLVRLLLRKYPRIAQAMARRHEMYNRQMEQIDRREDAGESLVIRPPRALGIGHMGKRPEELERVYRLGVQAAEARLEDIRRFLPLQKGFAAAKGE